MGSIDEISLALGRLESGQQAQLRWMEELARKQEETRIELAALKQQAAGTAKAVGELTLDGCVRGKEDRAQVLELKGDFKKLVGWLIAGNVAGAGAIEWLRNIFGS